jgi:3-hydroxyisobutyrate dehydrogenase-like beta-hydroxyacid dehydrogenase
MSTHKKTIKVGFIGLGHMGTAMAGKLIEAGHEVTVYNRTRNKAQGLIGRGAHLAARVADACHGEAVITMLADDGAVEDVVFGEGGVLQSMGRGVIHVSMSTISVALSERLSAAHARAAQRFVAAPVFGRPDAAASGKLFIIAGGAPDVVDACMPLFDAMGQKTIHIGDVPQAANLVKLSGNFLIASVLEALGEAMALIGKAGIDRSNIGPGDADRVLLLPATWICPCASRSGRTQRRIAYWPAPKTETLAMPRTRVIASLMLM